MGILSSPQASFDICGFKPKSPSALLSKSLVPEPAVDNCLFDLCVIKDGRSQNLLGGAAAIPALAVAEWKTGQG